MKCREFGNRHRHLVVFPNTKAFPHSKPVQISPPPECKNEKLNNIPMTIFHVGLFDSVPLVRSSVDGLILLLRRQWTEEEQQQPLLLWVCNPITREYVRIPNPWDRDFGLGLPYPPVNRRFVDPTGTRSVEPSRTSMQYKVVWISESQCGVYTLGTTGQWRSIAISEPPLRYNKWNAESAFLDGNLYWLDSPESRILAEIACFDLETEVFTYFSAPPTPPVDCYRTLCVLDDCLCLCNVYRGDEIEMWLMRRGQGYWSKKLAVNEPVSVTREFDIFKQFDYGYLFPIKVLEDGGNGNGMLLGIRSKAAILYWDGETAGRITHVYPSGMMDISRFEYSCAVIYTPSFLPLKTVLPHEVVSTF